MLTFTFSNILNHIAFCFIIMSVVFFFCLFFFLSAAHSFTCHWLFTLVLSGNSSCSSSSSSSDFWLTCRYKGSIHISGPPSTYGRSHTRSPGMSIMRVDSQELQLSAIPLCQLLPCHLGPPRAHAFHQLVCERLSWLHHWSIPHVHTNGAVSLSEWGPDPQCQAAQVGHWIWWWQWYATSHCRSVWSLP